MVISVHMCNRNIIRIHPIPKLLLINVRNKSKWNLAEKYSPSQVESNFESCVSPEPETRIGSVYSAALPPPNVTGALHLGHALSATLHDVLVRRQRMLGDTVCWLHGTDHAGIATQALLEKQLHMCNTSRLELGYDQFQTEIRKLSDENRKKIRNQLKRLDISLDYSKECFTMDENQTKAVKEAFIRLFDKGLIYRKNNLINWSCQLQTAISDIEVQNVDIDNPTYLNVPGYKNPIKFGTMTEFAYKIEGSHDEIVVATTRPETMLGDVAVAVHPDDTRYSHLISKNVKHPFIDKTIPIIADHCVDMNLGTGAVKITPAHNKMDYEIAQRHSLQIIPVINEYGKMEFSQFAGMKRYDARSLIIEKLDELKLLRGIKNHKMTIPICSRSGDIIELLCRTQWYIDCKRMSQEALNSVKNGDLKLIPKQFESRWFQWLEEEKDWCISRQLWWGHRIPVYKCFKLTERDKHIWIAAYDEEDAKLKSTKILKSESIKCEQETDVLDTWFSSALYPFSSHGWPNKSIELEKYYPYNLMVTGHDILCFWVYRMVMFGKELTGKLPFPKVLLHGIICDADGSKMSKSKGNVINPEDIVNGISLSELNAKSRISYENGILTKTELDKTLIMQYKLFPNGIPECGADALRFTLCNRNIKSLYINFDVKDALVNKLFCNKIWQGIRFTSNILNVVDEEDIKLINEFSLIDLWLLSRLSHLVNTVNVALDDYNFHIATSALKQFLYQDICDVYIECTKINSKIHPDKKKLSTNLNVLSVSFNTALRLLAPFMPYLTKELIPSIPPNYIIDHQDSIDNLSYPQFKDFSKWNNEILEENFDLVLDIVSVIRQMKSIYKIPKQVQPAIYIEGDGDVINNKILQFTNIITHLSSSNKLAIKNDIDCSSFVWSYNNNKMFKLYLESTTSHNMKKCLEKQTQTSTKKQDLIKQLEKLEKTMSAKGFKNAPENVHIKYKCKISALKDELEKFENANM